MISDLRIKDIVFFVISAVLYILGLISICSNIYQIRNSGDTENYYFFISGIIVCLFYTIYFILLLFKIDYKLIVCVPFIFYTLIYYAISNVDDPVAYITVLFVITYVFVTILSIRNRIITLTIILYVITFLFITKNVFPGILLHIEINSDPGLLLGNYIMCILILSGVITIMSVLLYDFLLYKRVQHVLKNKCHLTNKEIEFWMLHLHGNTPDEVRQIMSIEEVTYRWYVSRLRMKISYYGEYNKKYMWDFLRKSHNGVF